MPRVLGITGPAGAGKSFLLALFAEQGVPTIETDAVYRGLVSRGSPLVDRIGREFKGVVTPEGCLDRPALGAIVFANAAERERLNRVTHPALAVAVLNAITGALELGTLGVVVEAAVLFEAGLSDACDETWFVEADEQLRIDRVAASRGWDRARAASVVRGQGSMEATRSRCDRVIDGAAPAEYLRALVTGWIGPVGPMAGGPQAPGR